VASAGDINHDGYSDVIIGAPYADNNQRLESGSSYVVFGRPEGFDNVDLAEFGLQGPGSGFRIDGATAGENSGEAVGSAGDLNGDGFNDLIIGAPNAGNN